MVRSTTSPGGICNLVEIPFEGVVFTPPPADRTGEEAEEEPAKKVGGGPMDICALPSPTLSVAS